MPPKTGSEADCRLRGGSQDVNPTLVEQQNWTSPEERSKALNYLYCYLQNRAFTIATWYLERKTSKRRWARLLRFLAIVFTIIAAIGVVIVSTVDDVDITNWLRPLAFSLAIVAGGCAALDRLFGLSTSWMRFVRSALTTQRELDRFQLQWSGLLVEHSGDDERLVSECLTLARAFLDRLYAILQEESDAWAEEFRAELSRSERALLRELSSSRRDADGG